MPYDHDFILKKYGVTKSLIIQARTVRYGFLPRMC